MKTIIKILIIIFCFTFSFSGNKISNTRCDCKPVDHPYRALAKHDTVCMDLPERKTFITVETIRGWEKKFPVDLLIKTETNGRMSGTPEDTIYNLKGWIYSIKTDKADCDLHLQVGPQDPRKPRVVIEIPIEKCVLQDSIIKQFLRKGYKLNDQNSKGAYFEARGPAFFDGNNRGRPGKKRTAGCTWEIHPVMTIELK